MAQFGFVPVYFNSTTIDRNVLEDCYEKYGTVDVEADTYDEAVEKALKKAMKSGSVRGLVLWNGSHDTMRMHGDRKPDHVYEEKPPIGLKPAKIWREERIDEIMEAMLRYAEAGKSIPGEWVIELDEVVQEL
jgi:hypothetical protein